MAADDIADAITDITEPLAHAEGLDLVDVVVKGSGGRRLVRVVVDRKGGVDLERCQALSKRLSARLDEVDPVPDRYSLEVTSPGIDHPLEGRRAFERVEGRTVLVHRRTGEERTREERGILVAAGEDGIVLERDGTHVDIPYDEIAKARQTLPW